MLFSAAKVFLILWAPPTATVSTPDGIASVLVNGHHTATAVLIDRNGLMISEDVSDNPQFQLRFADGTVVGARAISRDEISRLVLLQIDRVALGQRTPITLSDQQEGKVTAFGTGDPIPGQMMIDYRVGQDAATRRFLPLTEYRFETPTAPTGGLALLDSRGELVGFLTASLDVTADDVTALRNNQAFGPTGLTLGYSLSPAMLKRVVSGFLSANHNVDHPTIGAFWRNAPQNAGVVITEVRSGSPADSGGLRAGDIVFDLDGKTITSGIQFAAMLFNYEVGDVIELKVKDLEGVRTVRVKIGSDGSL